jgi:type VI secretion system secreted protein Hcp
MAAFMKLGDIQGEATDQGHKNWIILETMSSAITRSIPEGAKDQQRSRGNTTLGDVVIVRQLDKSSTKLQEACANGTFYTEVLIDFCSQIKNKQEPYLKYKLSNVIVSSYHVNAHESGSPVPTESVTLAYTKVEWNYVIIDPKTGDNKGNVPAHFDPGAGFGG